ncbi:alginate lyase family protein [uncultured Draconibacterium sp.]|uniref:alginate lyase family protein n=1 Tax=uncultured Draconibacterium sp. TaxID=1573823 RepID=UPI0029C8D179|nr:alginate lyase family protein [uncultured Draconibacterium sp.]
MRKQTNYYKPNTGILLLFVCMFGLSCSQKQQVPYIAEAEQEYIIKTATEYLDSLPLTVTATVCERSAGGAHDFYSEGDYWWPDPKNPDGPYIRRDGQTNPDNFVAHRLAMIRFSQIVGRETSAYLLTGDKTFAEASLKHLEAWFINPETRMNPGLLYVQAIKGRVTGRGIGIIDAIHLIEVARSVEILEQNSAVDQEKINQIKAWFEEFVHWLTTHPYGLDEMNTKNNHATCWVMQVAAFARLTGNEEILEMCRNRFKNILLPNQMGENGSFPLELERTKPYGYSLFNLDAFFTTAEILSDENNNLYEFSTPDGKNLELGAEYLFPFILDKSSWPLEPDVMYWDEWPVRHPFLLFAGKAYEKKEYIKLWKTLEAYPKTQEVIRNLPIRNPLLWLLSEPLQ